jgi:hypothetical protein
MHTPAVRTVDPAMVVAEARSALAAATNHDEIRKIEASLDAIESHMRTADSYQPAELRAVNEERKSALARLGLQGGALTPFDPKRAKPVIETLKAAIEYAHRMQEWDAGMEAAELMVQWQREFVGWWDANVGVRHRPPGGKSVSADLRSQLTKDKAEAETKITHQQVSRWRNGLVRPDYAIRIFNTGYQKAMADKAQRRADLQTGEMEWFTPSVYIEKARRVLGGFDLDPASCALAQEVVQARRFFTAEDDGLTRDWAGAVWLNPPYAGKLIAAFAAKMLDQIACWNVTSAIMLTNGYTETSWFHNLTRACNALCLTRGRIKFESPHGEKCAPTNGQCFFYFGADRQRFLTEFGDVGTILVQP